MRIRFYLLLIAVVIMATMFTVSCAGDDITGVGRSSSRGDSGDNGNAGGDSGQTEATAYPDYTLYRIRVPFAVDGDAYTNVSFRDTNTLKQLWFDQINRKAANDGRVFAIRNRVNDYGPNDFQKKLTHGQYSAYDYYYFNENGDIVYKDDDTIIKKFVGAIITGYRDVSKKMGRKYGFHNNTGAIDKYTWTEKGIYTVGAIYANTLTTEEAKSRYPGPHDHQNKLHKVKLEDLNSTPNPFKDGVYDFITYRHYLEAYHDGWTCWNEYFERQYTEPGFIEVLVMYDYDNWGISGAASVHSYYPYYGKFDRRDGFNSENMSYMTNQNIYLAQRPEYTSKQLNHSAAVTDWNRAQRFLFMPGQKDVDTVGRRASTSSGQLPRW